MDFRVGFGTDVGQRRTENQDSGIALPELGLFVLADGMGGHRGGETASAMVTEIVPEVVRGSLKKDFWEAGQVLTNAILSANEAIYERAQNESQLQGMGTTTTALLFQGNTLTIGHVGDSRAYFFRRGAIWQLTRDHSLVQEKLRAGLITRAELKTDRMKNVITRSVGYTSELGVELYQMPVEPGDAFLLCSDGLSGLVDDSEILSIAEASGDEPQNAVRELIAHANSNGGDDNITVIMVRVSA
jgi:serine/threonine protein phosphatase PrpC